MTVVCWSVKGGSGTTVTAVSLARLFADRYTGAMLVDTQGDGLLVLGYDAPVERGVRTWLASPDDVGTSALDLLSIDLGNNLKVLPAGGIPDRNPGRDRWDALGTYLAQLGVPVIVDLGTLSSAGRSGRRSLLDAADSSLLVLRPCYLAVRRAIDFPVRPTGVVVVREDDRSISSDDISAALGVPVVATVRFDPRIARTVDAGLLGVRVPRPLARAYRHVAA